MRYWPCSMGLLLGLSLLAHAQDELPKTYQSFSFATVRIPVWVSDRNGLPIADLKLDDFLLFVDQQPVAIERCLSSRDMPLEVVYLIDLSGSMAMGGKLEGAIQAIDWLLAQHQADDRWRVIAFSDGQIVEVANERNAASWTEVKPKLRGYGKTALFDTLAALDHYFEPTSLNNRVVLAFTDGNDNHSQLSEAQLLKVLAVIRVPLFVVGVRDGFIPDSAEGREALGLSTLEALTSITGGQLFLAENPDQLAIVTRTLWPKLRPQYLLTITVESSETERHELTVRLKRRRNEAVRYRQGYLGSVPR